MVQPAQGSEGLVVFTGQEKTLFWGKKKKKSVTLCHQGPQPAQEGMSKKGQ